MLSVGDRVTDDILQKDLKNTAGLLIDEAGDTLDTTTTSKTTDGLYGALMSIKKSPIKGVTYRLGDTLYVVPKNLAVTLRAAFSKTLHTASARKYMGRTQHR